MTETVPTPLVGDIWKEVQPDEPRYSPTRYVRVVQVGNHSVFIHRVVKDERLGWVTPKRAPRREAQRVRFDGRRYGYTLVERRATAP